MPATRRTALLGMFGAMATLSLPRGARARPQPGLLRYGLSAWPPNLRPWVSTGASAGTVKMLLHRRLTRFNAQGELEGELAAEWRLDEDRVWVFRLRPEARFANGEPVTSRDVAWTIEQVAGERSTAYYAAQMRRIARVETPDAHTVRLVMREPLVTVPLWFANYNMPIGWHGSPDVNDPVAAGPYRIARQERGTFLELEAVPNYWMPGIPRTPRIRMVVYADENLRLAALQSGDMDMVEYVPWAGMAAVEADPRLVLDQQNGPFMDLLFNGTRPPFNNPLVRRACAHAIRREDIIRVAFSGRGAPINGVPIEPSTPFYDPRLAQGLAYDPDRARALLREAGYPERLRYGAAGDEPVRDAQGHRRGRPAVPGGGRRARRTPPRRLVDARAAAVSTVRAAAIQRIGERDVELALMAQAASPSTASPRHSAGRPRSRRAPRQPLRRPSADAGVRYSRHPASAHWAETGRPGSPWWRSTTECCGGSCSTPG